MHAAQSMRRCAPKSWSPALTAVAVALLVSTLLHEPRSAVLCGSQWDNRLSPVTVSKPCKDTFCGLHLHSYEYGTVVERVDQGGLAEAAGFDVGMQVLSVQDMDAATIEQVPVGLFCGPFPSPRDPDGTGLVVDERGVVQKIVSGGLASRWGEFKLGDQILSISNGVACGREASRRWVEGACLADYLETGKDAYLCIVKREKRASARTPLVETLMRRKHDAKPRFTTEREAAEALAHAGTYLRGYHV